MIFYLDTSILIKLYLEESDSTNVRAEIHRAERLATSWLAYPESRSVLTRYLKSSIRHTDVLKKFEANWVGLYCILPSELLLRRAGDLATKHGLRAFDAVHLASALSLAESSPIHLRFWSADRKLSQAANKEGLHLVQEVHS